MTTSTNKPNIAYIYIIRWKSRFYYLGSTISPVKRWNDHKRKPINPKVRNVWRKFGEPEFHILLEVPADKQYVWEQLCIDVAWGDKYLCNTNSNAKKPPSPKGRKLSAETKKKIADKATGRKHTEETKNKVSQNNFWKGKPAHNKGKKMSDEAREKMSLAKKGKPSHRKGKTLTDEHKQKISSANKGKTAWNKGLSNE